MMRCSTPLRFVDERLRMLDAHSNRKRLLFHSEVTALAKVKDILMTVAASCTDVLPNPQPFFGIAAHKDSAVEVDFKVWCKTSRYWDVKYYLEEQVKLAFDEANITIPFPQMDVHVVK